MTHQPPQPEASLSPYPIQEPPHVQNSPTFEVAEPTEDEADGSSWSDQLLHRKNVAGFVAAGVGALGVASAIFFANRGKQNRSNAKTGKRRGSKAKAE